MKILKNPVVAGVLAAVLIIGALLLNTRIKFGKQCREVSEKLYESGSIAAQLDELCVDASAIAAIAEQHSLDISRMNQAVDALRQALSQHSTHAADLFADYTAVRTELNTLTAKLMGLGIGTEDSQAVVTLQVKIQEIQDRISASDYNPAARAFLQQYDRFPTGLLAKLAGVSMPEEFA